MRLITDHKIPVTQSELETGDGVVVTCIAEADGERTTYRLAPQGGEVPYVLEFARKPIGEALKPGLTEESLIAVVVDRLRGFQGTDARCREHAVAITKLEEALHWMQHRTLDRARRGMCGTHCG